MAKEIQHTEEGYRVGETHHNATISDATVLEMRSLYEHKVGYKAIIEHFAKRGTVLHYNTIKKICTFKRRQSAKPPVPPAAPVPPGQVTTILFDEVFRDDGD